MMMDNNIIVHIGLHKTGTTYIQNCIFPLFKEITTIRAWHSQRNIIDMNFKKKILITDEGISGDPWQGNYFNSFESNLLKIKKLYRDPKIIFGIRNQKDFLMSLYKQYLHQKGSKSLDYVFNEQNTGLIKQEDLYFLPRIKLLKSMFSNVFVYSQETLKNDLVNFTNKLSLFFEESYNEANLLNQIDRNKNVGVETVFQVNLLRRLNELNEHRFVPNLYGGRFKKYKLTPRDICQNRLKNIKSEKYMLPDQLKHFIEEKYNDDWVLSIDYLDTKDDK